MSDDIPAACGCGRTTEITWSPVFGCWLCPDCRAIRTTQELSPASAPADSAQPGTVAYCAPGQEAATAVTLAFSGEPVGRIEGSPLLAGQDGTAYVVQELSAFLDEGWPFEIPDPTCRFCRGFPPWHSMTCPAFPWSAHLIPPFNPALICGI